MRAVCGPAITVARRELLRLLAKGPCTGEALRDELAARCGSKKRVEQGLRELRRTQLVSAVAKAGRSLVWELTSAGRAAAARQIAEEEIAKAVAKGSSTRELAVALHARLAPVRSVA
jgi:DNA-binding transcriptional ArsR family regulator